LEKASHETGHGPVFLETVRPPKRATGPFFWKRSGPQNGPRARFFGNGQAPQTGRGPVFWARAETGSTCIGTRALRRKDLALYALVCDRKSLIPPMCSAKQSLNKVASQSVVGEDAYLGRACVYACQAHLGEKPLFQALAGSSKFRDCTCKQEKSQ